MHPSAVMDTALPTACIGITIRRVLTDITEISCISQVAGVALKLSAVFVAGMTTHHDDDDGGCSEETRGTVLHPVQQRRCLVSLTGQR